MVVFFYRCLHEGVCAGAMPEWGSLDILEACGASDLGSNPSSGACAYV